MAIRNAKELEQRFASDASGSDTPRESLPEMCDVGVMFVSQLENGKPTAQLDKAIRVANIVRLNMVFQRGGRPCA